MKWLSCLYGVHFWRLYWLHTLAIIAGFEAQMMETANQIYKPREWHWKQLIIAPTTVTEKKKVDGILPRSANPYQSIPYDLYCPSKQFMLRRATFKHVQVVQMHRGLQKTGLPQKWGKILFNSGSQTGLFDSIILIIFLAAVTMTFSNSTTEKDYGTYGPSTNSTAASMAPGRAGE